MKVGIWRGTIVNIDSNGLVWVTVNGLNNGNAALGPCRALDSAINLQVGSPVLVDLYQGSQGAPVIMGTMGTAYNANLPGGGASSNVLAELYGDRGWTDLTLNTGTAYGDGYAAPSYRMIGTTVKVRGVLKPSSALSAGATIATLPSGYWPLNLTTFVTGYWNTSSWGTTVCQVTQAGLITIQGSAVSGGAIALDNIWFDTL